MHFILGDETEPETENQTLDHELRRRLIDRCDHISDEVSILRILDTLFYF